MKRFLEKSLPLGAIAVLLTLGAHPVAAQTIYVSQVGSGTAALGATAAPTQINEYSLAGNPATPFTTPTTTIALTATNTGNSTSEGFLTLSGDGSSLLIGGYTAAAGTATPNTATATAVPRAISIISVATGAVDTSTTLNNVFSAGNIRSVASPDGVNLFVAGSNTGIVETMKGMSTGTVISTTKLNNRVINIYNNNLVFTSGSATVGIYTIPGEPTSGTTTATLNFATSSSPYDFVFPDNTGTTVYVADSGAVGLEKYSISGTTATLQYSIAESGLTGLTMGVDGLGNSVLYGVTPTTLYSFSDSGTAFTATALATAPTNTAFRGVEFVAAAPEPSGLVAMVIGAGALGLLAIRRRRTGTMTAA